MLRSPQRGSARARGGAASDAGRAMSHFEYITVAFSIVVALCVARCLEAIPSALHPGRRYWIHGLWVFIKLLNVVVLWWSAWLFREWEWAYSDFIALLLSPGLIYLQVIFLVTTEPAAIEDWRSHYYAQARQFFLLNAALNPLLLAGNLLSPDPNAAAAVAQIGLFVGSLAAAFSRAEKVHAAFVVYTAAVNVVVFSGVRA